MYKNTIMHNVTIGQDMSSTFTYVCTVMLIIKCGTFFFFFRYSVISGHLQHVCCFSYMGIYANEGESLITPSFGQLLGKWNIHKKREHKIYNRFRHICSSQSCKYVNIVLLLYRGSRKVMWLLACFVNHNII